MSEDWDAIAQEVDDVSADLGSLATLYRKASGGPTAPHLPGSPTKDTTGTPLTYIPSSFGFKDNTYFKVETGDLAVLIPAQYSPLVGDRMLIRSESWIIQSIRMLAPQNTVLFYKAQLRKA